MKGIELAKLHKLEARVNAECHRYLRVIKDRALSDPTRYLRLADRLFNALLQENVRRTRDVALSEYPLKYALVKNVPLHTPADDKQEPVFLKHSRTVKQIGRICKFCPKFVGKGALDLPGDLDVTLPLPGRWHKEVSRLIESFA